MRGSGFANPQPSEVTTTAKWRREARRREAARCTRSMPLVTHAEAQAPGLELAQHRRQPGRRSPRADKRSR